MNYEIRIGKYVKEAWEIFMKAPEVFVVSSLVYFVLAIAFGRFPIIGNLLNILLSAFYIPAMYLAADYTRREGKGSFDMMKNALNFAPQAVVESIVSTIFISIGFLLLILPGIYLAVVYIFSKQFIVFKGKNFWEAMEASRKLVNKNWFGVFGLIIVAAIIGFFGFILLGIGILITLPFAILILFCAFADISAQIETTNIQAN